MYQNDPMKVLTGEVRLSYANLTTPRAAQQGGEPKYSVTLLIPTLFFGALLAGAAAGYRREGLWLREGRMTLRRQQGLYLHCICVFHPDVCLTAAQSPWAASVGRTNLTLTFPGWVKLKVRSVPLRDAEKFFKFMETN